MLLSINLEKHKKLRENVALEIVVSKSYASHLLRVVYRLVNFCMQLWLAASPGNSRFLNVARRRIVKH